MRRIFQVTGFLLILGASGPRAADLGDESHPRVLPDTIVVTANRFGLSEQESVWPTVTVDLEESGGRVSIAEALDGAGGVDIRESSGVGSTTTLSSWGSFNRHLLLLYNGRVVKDYSLGGFNLADYSIDEFERIELLQGPQSAFFGSDAIGGVVNLIPKTALADRLEGRVKYGSFEHKTVHIDMAQYLDRYDVGVGGFVEYTASDNNRANAGMDRLVFGVRTDYMSDDGRHWVALSSRYFSDSLGVPGPIPDADFIPVYGSSEADNLNAHQLDENYSVDLSYRFQDESLGQVHVDAFWEKKNLDYRSLYNYRYSYDAGGGVWSTDSVDVASRSIYNKRSSGISARIMRDDDVAKIAFGVDYLSGSLRAMADDTNYAVNVSGPYAPYAYSYGSYSFWSDGQDQFDVWAATALDASRSVRFDLSARLQYVKDRDVQESYNLGVVVTPTAETRVKLGYGYAFRLPSIADQFADDLYVRGNAELGAETSRSTVGRFSYEAPDRRLRGSVTVFHQQVDSLIQYVYNPSVFKSVPRNIEEFRCTGIEVAAGFQLTSFAGLAGSLVYQDAEQTNDGGRTFVGANYVPEVKWRLDINTIPASGLTLSGNVTYTSNRNIVLYGGMPKVIGKVYEFGLGFTYQVTDDVSVQLAGYDLTDEARPDQFGFTSTDGDYPSPGRRFLLDVSYRLF